MNIHLSILYVFFLIPFFLLAFLPLSTPRSIVFQGILVEANCDLNLAGKDGATPLFVAAQSLGERGPEATTNIYKYLKNHGEWCEDCETFGLSKPFRLPK